MDRARGNGAAGRDGLVIVVAGGIVLALSFGVRFIAPQLKAVIRGSR